MANLQGRPSRSLQGMRAYLQGWNGDQEPLTDPFYYSITSYNSELYVLDIRNFKVVVFDSTGAISRQWDIEDISAPLWIRMLGSEVFVLCQNNVASPVNVIKVYTSSGTLDRTLDGYTGSLNIANFDTKDGDVYLSTFNLNFGGSTMFKIFKTDEDLNIIQSGAQWSGGARIIACGDDFIAAATARLVVPVEYSDLKTVSTSYRSQSYVDASFGVFSDLFVDSGSYYTMSANGFFVTNSALGSPGGTLYPIEVGHRTFTRFNNEYYCTNKQLNTDKIYVYDNSFNFDRILTLT